MNWEWPPFLRRAINALPDVSDQPEEVQWSVSMLCSVAVHFVLLLFWILVQDGWVSALLPSPSARRPSIEIVIEPAPAPPEPKERILTPLDQLKERQRVDSEGLREAKKPTTQHDVQSDRDLEAGGKERPMGKAPVPQANGRQSSVDKSLVQRDARAGTSTPRTQVESQEKRMAAKTPEPKAPSPAKKKALQSQPGAEVARMEEIEDLGGEMVFRRVASSVAAPVMVSEKVGVGKRQKNAEDVPDSASQEGKEQSKVNGGLAENGKPGVNASRTPLAAYMKSVSRAVGARWNILVKSRMDALDTGSAKVRFGVSIDGKVGQVVLEQCTANREFADLCLEVVRQADLDPPPPEALPLMKDGLLEIPFTFSLY
ncbi:MAG: energy transducer TonB [Verrucomicrobia bacterium]|nr:energy transducer TonB [Verrucomicrobiota bacterium]